MACVEESLRIVWLWTCSSLTFWRKVIGLSPVDSLIGLDQTVLLLNGFVVISLMISGFVQPSLKHV